MGPSLAHRARGTKRKVSGESPSLIGIEYINRIYFHYNPSSDLPPTLHTPQPADCFFCEKNTKIGHFWVIFARFWGFFETYGRMFFGGDALILGAYFPSFYSWWMTTT